MSDLPRPEELPDGYFVEESPRGFLVLHADVARALHEAGYGPESEPELSASSLAGRKPLFELEAGGETFLVRRFSHGGLLRWATGTRFLDPLRPVRELQLSDALKRLGIRTPRVVAVRASAERVYGWRLELVTRRVEGTLDLGHVLTRHLAGDLPRRPRVALFEAFGDLVRRLHLHGFLHADLQPANVLVQHAALEGERPELTILDLDRSAFHDELTTSVRRANLRRLYRHVARRARRAGTPLARTDLARFLRGYDPERSHWKADWRSVASGHALGQVWHRIGWGFERMFGGKSPREDAGLIRPQRHL